MPQPTEAKATQQSARVAFEDAASRGFPNRDRVKLESMLRTANLAVALEELDEVATTITALPVFDPVLIAPVGTSDESPASFASPPLLPGELELTPEAAAFLNSLDEAPYADFGNH